jgi:hypothetical protein
LVVIVVTLAIGRTFAAAKAHLPEAALVDLYQPQRRSLKQIAHHIGSNEKIIARLARSYNIALRTPDERTRIAIDPDRLYDQSGIQGDGKTY